MNIHKHKSQSNNKTNNNNQLTPELNHHLIPSRNSRSLAQALPTKNKRWNSSSQKPAFTIIEVVLVLAIAGLIFLMVFIALPALQRNQRDTQRKNDMGRVLTAVQKYQVNNRGNMPSDLFGVSGSFIDSYLLANGDTFSDPDGSAYFFWEVPISYGIISRKSSVNPVGSTVIHVVRQAKCDGESVKAATGANNIAFVMVLEGGGKYCVNN